jgi:hypothetical protein
MKMLESDSEEDEDKLDYATEFNNMIFGISNKPSQFKP